MGLRFGWLDIRLAYDPLKRVACRALAISTGEAAIDAQHLEDLAADEVYILRSHIGRICPLGRYARIILRTMADCANLEEVNNGGLYDDTDRQSSIT